MNSIKSLLIAFLAMAFVPGKHRIIPQQNDTDQSNVSIEEAKTVLSNLEKEGYYKYADASNLDTLRKDFVASLANYGFLSSVYSDTNYIAFDYRNYMLDGETLFEQGGFLEIMKRMQPLFRKMGIKMEISNYIEEYDTKKQVLNHSVMLNGKDYIIFRNFPGTGWGEAAQRLAEILNDQMQLQGKDERLYLINAANDGSAVFLTESQHAILGKVLNNVDTKPMTVSEWCSTFGVNPKNYNKD